MRWTEHIWLEVVFLGGDKKQNPAFDESRESADWHTDGQPLAELLAEYEAQCARSNEIVAAAGLDDIGRHPDFHDGSANLRWILIHLVEETGRHAGHADIVRELLDGTKGYYWRTSAKRGSSLPRTCRAVGFPGPGRGPDSSALPAS